MPYTPRLPKASRWIDLVDLVKLVQTESGCSVETAREQIRAALADGAIWPRCWKPIPPPESFSRSARIPEFAPPGESEHWRELKIDWERNRIFDDFMAVRCKARIAE